MGPFLCSAGHNWITALDFEALISVISPTYGARGAIKIKSKKKIKKKKNRYRNKPELTLAKTSGTVTKDREKMANGWLPRSIKDPRSKCGTHFGAGSPLVTKVANGEKENNEHGLCTHPFPQERSRGGGGAVWSTDLKKPKHKCLNVWK